MAPSRETQVRASIACAVLPTRLPKARRAPAAAACVALAAACWAAALGFAQPARAFTWQLPASTLSEIFPNTPYPRVAVAPDGTTTVVWRQNNGLNDIIRASTRRPGGAWPDPATPGAIEALSAPLQDAAVPQVASGGDGTTAAIWSRFDGSNYRAQVAIRLPGQTTFGTPQTVSDAGSSAGGPQVGVAADGTVTAVWTRNNGSNDIVQSATRPAGQANFNAAENLSSPSQNADDPQIEGGSDGSATAVWRRSNGSNFIVQAATRAAGQASFGTPQSVSEPGQTAADPRLAIAGDGTTTISWRRSDGTGIVTQAATRNAGQAGFGTPATVSPAGVSTTNPEIASAVNGTTAITWSYSDGAHTVIRGVTREPGSTAFSAPATLSNSTYSAAFPQVTAAPDGTITVTWDRPNGVNVVAEASTRPPGGPWPDPNVAGAVKEISPAGGNASQPVVGSAADGSVTAAWQYYSPATGFDNIIQAVSSSATSYPLSVTKEGDGSGTVTSAPAGIDCGATCSAQFTLSSTVTLTASPASGSSFSGWGGSCSGEGTTCTVTVLGNRSATATFTKDAPSPTPSNSFSVRTPRLVGTRIRTLVTVPGAGRLAQAGTFRYRGKTRAACVAASRAVTKAAAVRMQCELTSAVRSARRKGAVRVRLATVFRPTGGTARTITRTVVLRSLKPRYTG